METYYIYLITNNVNGKTYIGQRHLRKYKTKIVTPLTDGYMGSGKYIVRAENKYGLNNFNKEILAICHDDNVSNILEISYIALYKSIGKAEYNIAEGGYADSRKYLSDEEKIKLQEKITTRLNSPEVKKRMSDSHKGKSTWNKGVSMSEESKEKIKESLSKMNCSEKSKKAAETRRKKGYKISEEHRLALINSHLGKHRSKESVEKTASKLRGRKRTEEQKQRMREAQLKRYKTYVVSEETKTKLSIANKGQIPYMKGKHHTEEAKRKISDKVSGEKNGFYGKHHSEETKKKLSEIGKKRIVSEETKIKISRSMKQKLANKRNNIL